MALGFLERHEHRVSSEFFRASKISQSDVLLHMFKGIGRCTERLLNLLQEPSSLRDFVLKHGIEQFGASGRTMRKQRLKLGELFPQEQERRKSKADSTEDMYQVTDF